MKSTCTHQLDVERWFDDEQPANPKIESHLSECTSCFDHIAFLTTCREAVNALPETPSIEDAQMPAFLSGIAEEVHAPRRSRTGMWAMASLSAAALIVAVSMMTITSEGPVPVSADSVIETFSTDIDGASAEVFYTDSHTPTVWLNAPEDGEL